MNNIHFYNLYICLVSDSSETALTNVTIKIARKKI